MSDRGGSVRRPARRLGRAVRWPIAATCIALVLVLAGFVLDQFPGRGRDLALVIGGPALTVLLPLSVIWLVTALVLRHRRGSRR
jgi:membrane protein DedA with SNARE-associated domain